MKHSKLVFKATLVLTFSGFMMANTKCQQQPAGRQLKKNIMVSDVSASTFLDNSGFSFSDTARSQFSGVLFGRQDFYERTIYPTPSSIKVLAQGGNQKLVSAMTTKTVEQLKTWFPTMKTQEILLDKESSCFMTRPQYLVSGKINALEAYSGGGLSFGFSQTAAPILPPISASLKLDKMRMDLSFHAVDPWTMQTVSSVNSSAMKTDYSAAIGIDLGLIHIGPEYYRKTGMAEVTLKGLQNAMNDLAKALLAQPEQEWSTRVMMSRDNYVVILGGAELGLRKGDKLKIFNEVHTWNGEACGDSSILTGSVTVSSVDDPWVVEVEDAGTLMTKAKVLNVKENETISTGALVKLHSFYVEPAPVKPGTVVAKP